VISFQYTNLHVSNCSLVLKNLIKKSDHVTILLMLKRFLFCIGMILFLSSCGTLQTPEFIGPGESRQIARTPSSQKTSLSDEIKLSWPVHAVRINRGFMIGSTRHSRHMGLDLGGYKNAPIRAAHDGYVIYAGKGFKGYGKMIILENTQGGYATFYAHLNQIKVKEGQFIHTGDTIGKMGRTGHATGVHLHFELRIAKLPTDPEPHLPTKNLAVTKK